MADASFVTDRGVVVPAVTGTVMREVDRVAIEELGPNLYQMMENAGRSLAHVTHRLLGETGGGRVVALAGTGGNGGGAICAARHLANHGAEVTVVVTDADRLTPVPAAQLDLYRSTPGAVSEPDDLPDDVTVVIDGLIGYGLSAAPRGVAAALIEWAEASRAPVVSLDVPSGVDATSGDRPGVAIEPAVTLTLAAPKTGLTGAATGELLLADIGIPVAVYRRAGVTMPTDVFAGRHIVPLAKLAAQPSNRRET